MTATSAPEGSSPSSTPPAAVLDPSSELWYPDCPKMEIRSGVILNLQVYSALGEGGGVNPQQFYLNSTGMCGTFVVRNGDILNVRVLLFEVSPL